MVIHMGEKILSSGKKVYTLNVRVPPVIYRWLKELEREGEYGNISDIVRTALFDFKYKLDEEKREKQRLPDRILRVLNEHPEVKEKVKKALLEEGL